MITLSPPRIDTTDMLRTLGEWNLDGKLEVHTDACLAEIVRAAAPALRMERDDTTVLGRFEELTEAIALVRKAENNELTYCELGVDPREDLLQVAVDRLDSTLRELTTPTGATP